MNSFLSHSYRLGQQTAIYVLQKHAMDAMDVVTPVVGSASPLLAGVLNATTAPKGHRAAAGFGVGIGGTIGAILGAVIGQRFDRSGVTGAVLGSMGGGAFGSGLGRYATRD